MPLITSKSLFQGSNKASESGMIIPNLFLPDVLEQPDDEQGVRPQDPGRHQVAGDGEDHALRHFLGHANNFASAW